MAKAAKPIPEGYHTVTLTSDAGQRRAGNRVVQEGIRRPGNRPPPWTRRQDHARRHQDRRLAHHHERRDARAERTEGLRRIACVPVALCRQLRRAVQSGRRRRRKGGGAAGRSVLGRPRRRGDRSRRLHMVDRDAQGRSDARPSSSSAPPSSSSRWRSPHPADAARTAPRENFFSRAVSLLSETIFQTCSTSIRSF